MAATRRPGLGRARALVGLAVLLLAGGGLRPAAGAAAGGGLPDLGPAPNFALTTQLDGRVWLAELRGRVVVLAFGCAACQACPALLPRLVDLERAVGPAAGGRLVLALVTLDPRRDTPRALRELGRARDLHPPAWLFLTEGRAGELRAVAERYGVTVRRAAAGVAGDCAVRLVDDRGRLRARHDGVPPTETLARDVRGLLAEAAAR